MTFIDAYKIVNDFTTSLAFGQRTGESKKRESMLKNTKKEICDAYKLFFSHALFWSTLPNDKLKLYEQCLAHIGDFCNDTLVDELTRINRVLKRQNPFTKIRNHNEKQKLEERKKQIEMITIKSMMEGMEYKKELGEYITWFNAFSKEFKQRCSTLPDDELDQKFPDMIGNFVCDIYEKASIERDYNDTEYFWPIEKLYQLSKNPKFDYLFRNYKSYISDLFLQMKNKEFC